MLKRLFSTGNQPETSRMSWDDYVNLWQRFGFDGVQYMMPGGALEELTALQGQRNPIVSACIAVRALVFSEIRFSFQRYSAGRPGDYYGTTALSVLERPWPSASTGDLLSRMELDVSLYGNSYWVRQGSELVRLDPTRVSIATADVYDNESLKPFGQRLVGYSVNDGKMGEAAFFTPDEVAHYRPLADPRHPFRGVSWLSSVLPDVTADQEMTGYKHAFLRNAATPNLVVTFEPGVSEESFKKFKERMDASHSGTGNAYKTLYLGAGADVKVVGSNLDQLSFKDVQGAGETRIAAAAGVPASILGISEGLAGSALNAGNYTATRRRFADGTMRPLWRAAAASLQTLVPPPDSGSRLWFDDRDVAFLQEDVMDAAEIKNREASTIESLIRSGFEPDSCVDAVVSGDYTRLVHTGLNSVQLQPPQVNDKPE
jgi:HK97 family phage portal protein